MFNAMFTRHVLCNCFAARFSQDLLGIKCPAPSSVPRSSPQARGNWPSPTNATIPTNFYLKNLLGYLTVSAQDLLVAASYTAHHPPTARLGMPPLPSFSDNPLRTRSDLLDAVYALLTPLIQYQSPNGARIRIPVATAAHFGETAAQLEGFARPLWAIGALLAAEPKAPIDEQLRGWINGFAVGTDPSPDNEEYWGDVLDTDQRMVEIEILGFALLAAPDAFLGPSDSKVEEDIKRRQNITRYLRQVNGKTFPQNNWLWFRVMANLALVKSCGVPYEELKSSMDADLAVLDTFYVGDGWASDGPWNVAGRQMDYYSGSYAIQFSQLMYVRFAKDVDPKRCEVYRERARAFALDFWRYFNENGASIPFGRSLTYRFAMGGFWAAVTMAEVDLPDPLTPGVVKGLLLRHLRYWASNPDIFYPDGTLNIGFHYPNMYMSEDYNSPQSPYWCMKIFCMLTLASSHPFWSCAEEPMPFTSLTEDVENLGVKLIKQPKQILVNSDNHHYMLSSGQYCGWPLKATSAKYSKFAYSSSFGFSVPTGPLIQQLAPDSTLALSLDEGESWKIRWRSEETTFSTTFLKAQSDKWEEKVPTLVNIWKPSKASEVEVETTLIPPTSRWPDWHIRIHKLTFPSGTKLQAIEGGFAILGRGEDGSTLQTMEWSSDDDVYGEGIIDDGPGPSTLIVSRAGASGIRSISLEVGEEKEERGAKGVVLKPDSNTNLMCQQTLIPTIQQDIVSVGDGKTDGRGEVTIAVAVFAVNEKLTTLEICKRWYDIPRIYMSGSEALVDEDGIVLQST
ncbi:hypothetical protein BDZ45DRAFT_231519 [Acephala macrosclerotiorum]|nr:hypothetical protein BDZ45DRAFT_231519 [Acephala macrosclerotiorum]